MLRKLVLVSTTIVLLGVYSLAKSDALSSLPSEQSPFLRQLVLAAQQDAKTEFRAAAPIDNTVLNELSYQQYRAIRFKAEESIWRGLYPYEVQLFHTGFLYQQAVNLNIIDYRNRLSSLPFSSQYFNYDPPADTVAESIKSDVGFAGFRIHYPLNDKAYKDELAVFLGATYFRLIGKHQKYGLSARGLAIDTAEPEGEEFPYFTDFWLIEPANGKTFSLYAKMDSPSITGVYKFTIQASEHAEMDVEAWLFARDDIDKLGLAPFTSMFLYGENSPNKPDDFRPEVHDSDGLMLITDNNEQLWRPLENPNRLRITSLSDNKPKGFGMLQRDIQFGNYLDTEADYHQRPGLWVTPIEGFNDGRLELVEIPTNSETHDNIVAYWVNNQPFEQGMSHYVRYSLKTVSANVELGQQQVASVLRTLQGADVLPGEESDEDSLTRRFVVDFTAPDGLSLSGDELSGDVSANNGTVEQLRVFKSNFDNEIRATFLFTPNDEDSINDLRLVLTHKGKAFSEIWTYVVEK
jgi:glucans biosynthesis protein